MGESKYLTEDEIKQNLRELLKLKDDVIIKREKRYDLLNNSESMFFSIGTDIIYATTPSDNKIRSYSSYERSYLEECLELSVYPNKTMMKADVDKFINHPAFAGMFLSRENNNIKIRTICASLEALGYDKHWIEEKLKPTLEKRFL